MHPNILLIEDNKAGQELMKQAFQAASITCPLTIMENGTKAIQFLKREKKYKDVATPDLVLLDLNLPGKTGIEVLEEIKKNESLKDIPVVVLTGSNASEDIEACSKYRCQYILKPARFKELVTLVRNLTHFYEKKEEIKA